MKKNRHIENLIAKGEDQHLDFKFNITDSKKIARSISAFSNSKGGILLIGVRDNGSIAGVQSDEELFMLEAALNLYCRPQIQADITEWNIENKSVLEVSIPEAAAKPVFACDHNDKWLAWIRYADTNILANSIMVRVWKRKQKTAGTFLTYSEPEKKLLRFLEQNEAISISHTCRLLNMKRKQAETILVNLISIGSVKIEITDTGFHYTLNDSSVDTFI